MREAVELEAALVARLPASEAPRAVSVTDLVAPRRAFWNAISPVKIDAVRQRRVDRGRELHRRLGVALSTEGALEVRVRRDGVVGRIDLLSDIPVEVKTSSSAVEPDQLRDARPEQVEQLAMYCVLAGKAAGRLVTLVVAEDRPEHVQAVDLALGSPEAVRAEMATRADALRQSWRDKRADRLPGCRWFGRGCEFRDARVCDCTGDERPPSAAILDEVRQVADRPDVSDRIGRRLRGVPGAGPSPTLERFRDLLYPRRAYFERRGVDRGPELPRRGPDELPDLYGRLIDALESGPLGEVARVPPRSEEPEEVVGFRGLPLLVRTTRRRDRPSPATLLDQQPQYALELGFRCVATGRDGAYLVLGRERAEPDRDRVLVFEYRFAPATVFARMWRTREQRLAAALAARAPADVAPCPEWMYADCPYRSDCACGARGARSQ